MNTPCVSFRRKVKTYFAPGLNLLESSGRPSAFKRKKQRRTDRYATIRFFVAVAVAATKALGRPEPLLLTCRYGQK